MALNMLGNLAVGAAGGGLVGTMRRGSMGLLGRAQNLYYNPLVYNATHFRFGARYGGGGGGGGDAEIARQVDMIQSDVSRLDRDKEDRKRGPSEAVINVQKATPNLGPKSGEYAPHLNSIITYLNDIQYQLKVQNEMMRKSALDDERAARETELESRSKRGALGAGGIGFGLGAAMGRMADRAGESMLGFLMNAGVLTAASFFLANQDRIQAAIDYVDNIGRRVGDVFGSGDDVWMEALQGIGIGGRVGIGLNAPVQLGGEVMSRAEALQRMFRGLANAPSDAWNARFDARQARATNMREAGRMALALVEGKERLSTRGISAFANAMQGVARFVQRTLSGGVRVLFTIAQRLGETAVRTLSSGLRILGRTISILYTVAEVLILVWNLLELYNNGEITEAEFERRCKVQLRRVLEIVGMPLILQMIGGGIGTLTGPAAVILAPVGSILGLVVGVFWGDELLNFLGGDAIVDVLYEIITFLGDPSWNRAGNIAEDIGQIGAQLWSRVVNFVQSKFRTVVDNVTNTLRENWDVGLLAIPGLNALAAPVVAARRFNPFTGRNNEVADEIGNTQIMNRDLNDEQRRNAEMIYNRFMQAFDNEHVAEAAVANAYHESGLRSRPGRGDGGNSVGLFQLNTGPYSALGRWALRENPSWTIDDLERPENNISAMISAIESGAIGEVGKNRLLNARDLRAAVEAFTRYAERPSDMVGQIRDRTQTAMDFTGMYEPRSQNQPPVVVADAGGGGRNMSGDTTRTGTWLPENFGGSFGTDSFVSPFRFGI